MTDEQRAALLSLADRCEQATGADRELDALVWLTCVPGTTRNELRYIHKATGKECVIDETRDANRCLIVVPAYTASVDAAMTLVPSGWRIIALAETQIADALPFEVRLSERNADFGRSKVVGGDAATPARALTAAALRAIAKDIA
jgi:hypothetical protein